MENLRGMLDTAFTKLCEVSFCGRDAEKVADIKSLMRQVFQELSKEEESSDG